MPIEEQAEEKIQNAVQTIITGGAKLMLRIPKGVAMALLRSGMKLTKTGVRTAGEAVNNKIKLTVRMGYGFRNIDNLIALVMLRCSNLPITLPGRG